MILSVIVGRPRAGCWEVRGGHWDRNWELGCGEWGLVGPLFLKAGPGVSGFRPLVKERTERLTLLFHNLSRRKFAAEERMLGVVTLQDGVFTWFWWGEWWDPWWHQRPCAVQRRVHLKTPVASWSFREETMLAYLGFKSMKIPACLRINNKTWKLKPYHLLYQPCPQKESKRNQEMKCIHAWRDAAIITMLIRISQGHPIMPIHLHFSVYTSKIYAKMLCRMK